MAGLIAGRDAAIPPGKEDEEADHYFVGAAPGARIVSIKVAASDGATDVSQVIAAIDWIVQHRNSDGLNIRVLNLSFGTDGTQDYQLDPLAYAAEVAWLTASWWSSRRATPASARRSSTTRRTTPT